MSFGTSLQNQGEVYYKTSINCGTSQLKIENIESFRDIIENNESWKLKLV